MGRIKERKELKDKRGPGRKARKQKVPDIPNPAGREDGLGVKEGRVGGRIKQRARKRALVLAAVKAVREEKIHKKKGKKKAVEEEVPLLIEAPATPKWLKPIVKSPGSVSKKKGSVSFSQDLLSDGNSSEDDEGSLFILLMF